MTDVPGVVTLGEVPLWVLLRKAEDGVRQVAGRLEELGVLEQHPELAGQLRDIRVWLVSAGSRAPQEHARVDTTQPPEGETT